MFGHDFFLSAQRTDCEGIASSPIAFLLSTVLPRTFSPFLSTFLAVFPAKHSFSSLLHYYGRNNLFSDFLFSFYLPIRLSTSYFRFSTKPFSFARLSRIFWAVSFAIVPLYKYPSVKRAIFPYEKVKNQSLFSLRSKTRAMRHHFRAFLSPTKKSGARPLAPRLF